ncbi:hypothetical protein [Nocardia sp. NPDC003345]
MFSYSASRTGAAPVLRWVLAVLSLLFLLVTAAAAVFADTQLVRTEVVASEVQPSGVDYDGATYHAGLVRQQSWLLHRRLPDIVLVGRDPGLGYGHPVSFEILGNPDPRLESVDWRPEGVAVRFDSGHEIFLPAAAFTGGR